MILELFVILILLVGLIGMSVIIFRKIPVLAGLSPEEVSEPGTFKKIKESIKNNGTLKYVFSGVFLQNMLSKIRTLILKAENSLRQKTLENKNKFSDDYWEKIKREK